jgi:hypothetical protein
MIFRIVTRKEYDFPKNYNERIHQPIVYNCTIYYILFIPIAKIKHEVN